MNKTYLPALLFAAVLGAAPLTAQVAIPYSHDFSSAPENFEFTTAGLTLDGGTLSQTTTGDTDPVIYLGVDQVGNIASVSDFEMSYQMSFSSFGTTRIGNRYYAGFSFFGTSSTVASNPSALFYFSSDATQDFPRLGRLQFANGNDTSNGIGTFGQYSDAISGDWAVAIDTTYTLRLTGVLTGTSGGNNLYDLTFGLYDGAGTTQLGTGASVTGFELTAVEPVDGYYAGLLYRVGTASGTTTVAFDNFAAVPEPSTWALLAGSFLVLVVLARRRASA